MAMESLIKLIVEIQMERMGIDKANWGGVCRRWPIDDRFRN